VTDSIETERFGAKATSVRNLSLAIFFSDMFRITSHKALVGCIVKFGPTSISWKMFATRCGNRVVQGMHSPTNQDTENA